MNQGSTFVGLDVHVKTMAVAVASGGDGPVRSVGVIPNTPQAVATLVRKLGPAGGLRVCYEAGPCGYGLYRQLTALGVATTVVAPSLIPTTPGERVKTDRRDAAKLARLHRSGDLAPVWVPDAAHEALRDLTRARQSAQQEAHRVRQRLAKLLARQGVREPAGKRWTQEYRRWLAGVTLAQPCQRLVLAELHQALAEAEARLARLTAAIEAEAATGPFAHLIAALQCLRGVGVLTAVTLVAELGDLTRFAHPRQVMAYAGVVPSEHSSGGRQQRGRITKTGNAHVRHVIVEAAWHSRRAPHVSRELARRHAGQPAAVVAIAATAQQRGYRRYRRLVGRGKSTQKAVVAVARELLGFVWAMAQVVTPPAPARAA